MSLETWLVASIAVAGAGLWAGWLVMKRPLEIHSWATRRSLLKAGLKRRVLETPTGKQTVYVGGQGPLLVLLHGAGDHAGTWYHVAADLTRAHALIVPDLAGHGASEPAAGPIHVADIVGALESLLGQLAGGQPITLVGNSLGAWMAFVLARRRPDWVVRLVAVNGGPLMGPGTVNLLPGSREEARIALGALRDPSSPKVPDHVLDDMVRRQKTGPLARFSATAATMAPWVFTEEHLGEVKVPVRLLWGLSDQLLPLSYAERMRAVLPDARIIPLERCGHVPQQEAPERFKAALLDTLGPPGP